MTAYAITYVLVKGSPISAAEYDATLHNFDDRITDLETNPPTPDNLSSAVLVGSELTFYQVSGASFAVTINLPRSRDRGTWDAGGVYAVNDTFTVDGDGLYVVLADHTAAGTFDSDEDATPATAAGSFVTGKLYIIVTVGTTDFTAIGASANTVGVTFRATGAGSGTGTAGLKLYDRLIAALNLTTATLGDISDVTLTSVGTADFIAWSGSAWTNLTPAAVTALLDAVVGDSGAGGTKGLVPAPAAGDAAAGKYLDAAGTYSVPPGSSGQRWEQLVTGNLIFGIPEPVTFDSDFIYFAAA